MTGKKWSAGWFGKLPCVGDFVRAGLPPRFIADWDAWMQLMMAGGREALAEGWQACYMEAPIWRFAMPRDICGGDPAAGIVMPSVDRVGRQYPLCLAVTLAGEGSAGSAWDVYQACAQLYEPLETIALSMLDDGCSLDTLEQALAGLPAPQEKPEPLAATSLGNAVLAAGQTPLESQLAGLASRSGSTLWVAAIGAVNRTLLCRGMPEGQDLAATLFNLDAPVWQDGRTVPDFAGVEQ